MRTSYRSATQYDATKIDSRGCLSRSHSVKFPRESDDKRTTRTEKGEATAGGELVTQEVMSAWKWPDRPARYSMRTRQAGSEEERRGRKRLNDE